MGSDDFFKKRKGNRQKRKIESKELAPYRYLLVCEGTKTEPNYFMGIKKLIDKKFEGKVKINSYNIQILGTGRNTEDLVRYTKMQVDRAISLGELPYGHVWVVFDKDDFSDEQFNNAIIQANNNEYKVAWSNEAIELWFLLYFEYLQSAIDRQQYIDKLNQYFEVFGLGKYEKNMENIFEILQQYGELNKAIANAKRLRELHEKMGNKTPSDNNPCTTVDLLVEELMSILN